MVIVHLKQYNSGPIISFFFCWKQPTSLHGAVTFVTENS